jgi:hypothetical protein
MLLTPLESTLSSSLPKKAPVVAREAVSPSNEACSVSPMANASCSCVGKVATIEGDQSACMQRRICTIANSYDIWIFWNNESRSIPNCLHISTTSTTMVKDSPQNSFSMWFYIIIYPVQQRPHRCGEEEIKSSPTLKAEKKSK